MWITKFRTDRRRGRGRLVTVDRSLRGRARSLNWHGATGVWILLGALFLSATGITWSTHAGAHVSDLRAAMEWQRPQLDTDLTGSGTPVSAHGEHDHGGATGTTDVAAIDFDAVVASAATGGVQAPLEITLPSESGHAVAVTEIDKPFRLTTDAAAVDPASLSVTGTVDYDEDYSLIAKLADWGIRGHMGILFGLLNQLLLVLVAAGLSTMIVLGYRMWWQRRPTRGSDLAFGRAPRRGAIRHVGVSTAAAVVAAAIVVGWFLPMLGLGLVAFLAIDLVVAAVTTRRRPTTVTQSSHVPYVCHSGYRAIPTPWSRLTSTQIRRWWESPIARVRPP